MKFGRNYQIQIRCDDEVAIIKPPFTVIFSMIKDTQASANTLNMRILNLSQDTRQKIFQDRFDTKRLEFRTIEFRAGYGNDMPIIFVGNIQQAYSYRDHTEWVTDIQAWDGGEAFANSFSNFTLNAGNNQNAVIDKLITDLKSVNRGVISDFIGVNGRARTYFGNTTDLLREEVGYQGNFFIENGTAFCLKNNDGYTGEVELINSGSGLLGTPRRFESRIDIDVLFEPRITVGQVLRLESREQIYSGNYKVMGYTHSGVISESANGELATKIQLYWGTQGIRTIG